MPEYKDEYLNIIKNQIAEASAGVVAEETIGTGLTYTLQGIAMEVWEIHATVSIPKDTPAAVPVNREFTTTVLSAEGGIGALPEFYDLSTFYYLRHILGAGVATYLPMVRWYEGHPVNYILQHPRLYAFPELYHYIQSTNASQLGSANVEVGFLYVDIGQEQYFEVLQRYLQLWG